MQVQLSAGLQPILAVENPARISLQVKQPEVLQLSIGAEQNICSLKGIRHRNLLIAGKVCLGILQLMHAHDVQIGHCQSLEL